MVKRNNKGQKKKKSTPAVKPVVLANNVSPRPIKVRRNKVARPATKMQHIRSVCTLTDPFCPAAKNAKWPDGTSGNTLTEQFRGNVVVTPLTGGNYAIVFSPSAPFGYLLTSSVVAGPPAVCTFTSGYATYRTGSLLATFGDQYRIVSAGVICRCIASATNAAGLITFGTTGVVPAASSTLTLGNELYDEVTIKAIQPGMELSWVSQPRGSAAREFRSQTTTALTSATHDWTSLIVEISGAPTSACLQFEWFINVEFNALSASAITAVATRNPPSVPSATTAVSKVHHTLGSFIEGGVKQVEESISKHASDALSTLMADPMESIATLFAMF